MTDSTIPYNQRPVYLPLSGSGEDMEYEWPVNDADARWALEHGYRLPEPQDLVYPPPGAYPPHPTLSLTDNKKENVPNSSTPSVSVGYDIERKRKKYADCTLLFTNNSVDSAELGNNHISDDGNDFQQPTKHHRTTSKRNLDYQSISKSTLTEIINARTLHEERMEKYMKASERLTEEILDVLRNILDIVKEKCQRS